MIHDKIRVFCRLKPISSGTASSETNNSSVSGNFSCVIPGDNSTIYKSPVIQSSISQSNSTLLTKDTIFPFGCFNQDTSQEKIFQEVAPPIVDNVIRGYNGTIFAYGQTNR